MNFHFFISFLCFEVFLNFQFTEQFRKCEPPLVPGIEQMARGIDLTRIDMLPVEPKQDLGYRKELFEFSCDQNRKWKNDKLYPNVTFSLPDQIDILSPNKLSKRNCFTTFEIDVDEIGSIQRYDEFLKANYLDQCDSYRDCKNGSLLLSNSYQQLQRMFAQTNSTMLRIWVPKSFTRLHTAKSFYPYCQNTLSQDFANETSNLPAEYAKNPAPYEALLNKYGTHYFMRALFSRFVFLLAFIERNHFDIYSILCAYLEDVFNKECGQNIDMDKWLNSTQMSTFHKQAIWKSHFYGGSNDQNFQNGPLDSSDAYESWTKSALANPWLYNGRVSPITALIEDRKISKQVQIAIEAKISKAYLQNLKYTLQLLEQRQNVNYLLLGVFSPARVMALIDQITDQTLPDKEAISRIKLRVDKILHFNEKLHK